MGPTRSPSGADRNQVGPILVPWTLLSGCSQMMPTNKTNLSLSYTIQTINVIKTFTATVTFFMFSHVRYLCHSSHQLLRLVPQNEQQLKWLENIQEQSGVGGHNLIETSGTDVTISKMEGIFYAWALAELLPFSATGWYLVSCCLFVKIYIFSQRLSLQNLCEIIILYTMNLFDYKRFEIDRIKLNLIITAPADCLPHHNARPPAGA